MNKFIKYAAIFVCACTLTLSASACNNGENSEGGAANNKYQVYTNIPDNEILNISGSYELAEEKLQGGYDLVDVSANSSFDGRAYTIFAMDTRMYIVLVANFNDEEILTNYNKFIEEAKDKIEAIETSLSTTISSSYISKFNNAEAGAKVELDEISYTVLSTAKSIYTLTEGYYNPAVYYNVQAYGFGGGLYPSTADELPSDEEIAKYNQLSAHFNEVALREEDGKYYVTKPDYTVQLGESTLSMKIDLGGIGKGYTVDIVNALVDKYGFKYGYVNFGSSSMALKKNSTKGNYTIAFTDPRNVFSEPGYMQTYLSDVCISTSGDYEQYYVIDGVRYCHIIDPTTGKPVSTNIMTATVIGGSAAENDAITTAIMAMGKDKAITFINEKLTDKRVTFTYDPRG